MKQQDEMNWNYREINPFQSKLWQPDVFLWEYLKILSMGWRQTLEFTEGFYEKKEISETLGVYMELEYWGLQESHCLGNYHMGHFLSSRSTQEAEEECKAPQKDRVGSWEVSLPKNDSQYSSSSLIKCKAMWGSTKIIWRQKPISFSVSRLKRLAPKTSQLKSQKEFKINMNQTYNESY